MRITDLLKKEAVLLHASATDKQTAIDTLISLHEKAGNLTDVAQYKADILAREALGTTAIGGMLSGLICQIFIVPVLFVVFQYLQEKLTPMTWHDIESNEAASDIEQYTK